MFLSELLRRVNQMGACCEVAASLRGVSVDALKPNGNHGSNGDALLNGCQ